MEPLNDLTILLALFPEKPWNPLYLSSNPNISLAFIESHGYILTTFRDPPNAIGIRWESSSLLKNPNIDMDFVRKYQLIKIEWSIDMLSVNPNINWKTIINNKNINWSNKISLNPNIDWSVVINHPSNIWNYSMLSANPNITLDIIRNNSNIPWSYWRLSSNPNINWNMVRNNLKKSWNWFSLLEKIPISTILSNLTYFPYPRDETIFEYKESKISGLNLDIVLSHPKIAHKNDYLASNPGITWEDINKRPDLFKNDEFISLNPNLNWKIVYNKNIRNQIYGDTYYMYWHFDSLSKNTFGYRTYSWAEFLADKEVDDKVKLTVWNYHTKGKEAYNLDLIMAIYNVNSPHYLPLVGYYFTEKYPNLGFDVEFDTSLPMKEIIANLEQFVEEEMKREVEGSQEFERAKQRFGQKEKY